jgi:hypothetical protein
MLRGSSRQTPAADANIHVEELETDERDTARSCASCPRTADERERRKHTVTVPSLQQLSLEPGNAALARPRLEARVVDQLALDQRTVRDEPADREADLDRVMTGCFGRLTARDEMVAKGLAASLACSTERGQDRW